MDGPPPDFETVASLLRAHEVGRRAHIETPFGRRLVAYADLTATGRYLHFVEAWIRRVRPFYANTHTAVSSTGRILTELREQAREVVRRGVGAGPDDLVLFCGAGATAAINKLVGLLGWKIPEPLDRAYDLSSRIPPNERPLVLLGPYEHHSNELPWVESVADVVEVGLDDDGRVDLSDLEAKLEAHADRPVKLGSFSAASNVTGVLTDVHAVARRLHAHGAYACFDFAAAGPYVPIEMHPQDDPAGHLDAVYLSCHKFIGGPEASGVLVVKRDLVRSRVPERPGGGTVAYVAAADHDAIDYLSNPVEREEGGTPDIMGDLRAGAAMLVKAMVGADRILEHERSLARAGLERLRRHPKVRILGPADADRLAILSFNIDGLHHDLVSALLDHLFGIQNRAGCSCAGPYGHRLLGIDRATSERYRRLIARGVEGIKPGWVRLTLPFYASPEDVEFLLSAVEFVADHGRTFVPLYELDWSTGVWHHRERPQPDFWPIDLSVEALAEAAHSFAAGDHEAPIREAEIAAERARYFEHAHRLVGHLERRWAQTRLTWNRPTGDAEIDALRWFDYVYDRGLDLDAPAASA
ncbi:MAG: aminotransferase class V-fold PLP-dependent enzyme [Deltaproteobacteria bacterium]|nr:MAG: aminotransferase class V-fold PLP-dependent enzyme [Deltaproteobacteria bacterium]